MLVARVFVKVFDSFKGSQAHLEIWVFDFNPWINLGNSFRCAKPRPQHLVVG